MRYSNDPQFAVDDNNSLGGIILGSDLFSEHEQGITPLYELFDVNEKLKARRITRPECVTFKHTGDRAVLIVGEYNPDLDMLLENRGTELCLEKGTDVASAWDKQSFGILVSGTENIGFLTELHQAILNCDITICLRPARNPLMNLELTLLIDSKIQAYLKQQEEQEEEVTS